MEKVGENMKQTNNMKQTKKKAAGGNQYRVKVTKNGPYRVTGGVPLAEQNICVDKDDECHGWEEGKKYPDQESYSLCRCGHSQNKPYCDGSHVKAKFEGTEEAGNTPYREQSREFQGPGIKLTDAKSYCARARFCHRAGGAWKLITESDDPAVRQTLIEETLDCPSGRLIAWDKDDQPIEPDFQPSIGLVNDTQAKKKGPIWVRGGIPVESAEEKVYETRKQVTLCRCGKSANKPFCDGKHLD